MKWHSLLRNPNDLPQRINRYEESEDVMVIERILHNVLRQLHPPKGGCLSKGCHPLARHVDKCSY